MSNESAVLVEVLVPASIDQVWNAFRDRDVIRQWHGWDYPEIDAEIDEIYFQGVTVDERNHTIQLGGHVFAMMAVPGGETIVRMTRGRPPADPEKAAQLAEWEGEIEAGWLSFLQQLRFHLTFHAGEVRRTLFLQGDALAAVPVPVSELLTVAPQPSEGGPQRYRALGAGTELAGEMWFHTAHQIALTVKDWGPGLALFAYSPSATVRYGSLMATVTTYGLSDEQFADLETQWTSWWARHYAPPANPVEEEFEAVPTQS